MKTYELEYYNRSTKYCGIGTFHVVDNKVLNKGDNFIVPAEGVIKGDDKRQNGRAGCCEGRTNHSSYLKPILLTVKGQTDTHIISETYGSWARDICLVENE